MLSVSIVAPSTVHAQGNQGEERSKGSLSGPRKHLATILFAGLGGAILGLSTLSFYGRPQEKLSNIAIGFALGIIGGTTYVTYKAATRPDEFYGTGNNASAWLLQHEAERVRLNHGVVFKPLAFQWEF